MTESEGGEMKYTQKQLDRTIKKLARAYGYWNCPNIPDRDSAAREVTREAFNVIRKSGMYFEYQKAIRKAFNKYKGTQGV